MRREEGGTAVGVSRAPSSDPERSLCQIPQACEKQCGGLATRFSAVCLEFISYPAFCDLSPEEINKEVNTFQMLEGRVDECSLILWMLETVCASPAAHDLRLVTI